MNEEGCAAHHLDHSEVNLDDVGKKNSRKLINNWPRRQQNTVIKQLHGAVIVIRSYQKRKSVPKRLDMNQALGFIVFKWISLLLNLLCINAATDIAVIN